MYILDTIEAKRMRQVVPRARFAFVEPEYAVALPPPDRPNHFQWKYGIQLSCVFTGPEKCEEQFTRQARRMLARELYGELEDDLLVLLRLMMEDGYRPSDDPVMQAIEGMLRKIRD